MTTLTFERMIRASTEHHVCRVWRAPRPQYKFTDEDVRVLATDKMTKLQDDKIDLVTAVADIVYTEGVSAVEITDRSTGDGLCVYKNWP